MNSLKSLRNLVGSAHDRAFAFLILGFFVSQHFPVAWANTPAAQESSPIVLIAARGLDEDFARSAFAKTVEYLAEKVPPGTKVYLLDPVSRSSSSFTLPEGTGPQRVRKPAMNKGLGPVRKAFLDTPAKTEAERVFNLPQVLSHLAAQVIRPGQTPIVIFYGHPGLLVSDPRFLPSSGAVPHAHWLFADTGPFAARPKRDLAGWRVHFVTPEGWFRNEYEEEGLRRFISTYVALSNARLISMSGIESATERLGDTEGIADEPLEDDGQLGFWHQGLEGKLYVKTARETAPLPSLEGGRPATSKLGLAMRASTKARSAEGEASVIVAYDRPGMRADLVVLTNGGRTRVDRNNPGSEADPVFYHEGITESGVHYHEVVFRAPPEKGTEAWLNLTRVTEGRGPTAGELGLIVDRIRYGQTFDFEILRGDEGQDWERRGDSIFWMRLPLEEILKP